MFSLGLEMDIFINQGEYTALTDEAGVRVVLTDQTRMPFPFHDLILNPSHYKTPKAQETNTKASVNSNSNSFRDMFIMTFKFQRMS